MVMRMNAAMDVGKCLYFVIKFYILENTLSNEIFIPHSPTGCLGKIWKNVSAKEIYILTEDKVHFAVIFNLITVNTWQIT